MPDLRLFGSTSNLVRFTIKDKTTGQGKTGLTGSTTGLIISTIADNESAPTVYTQAASHIQTIATLGTYAAPSASNCRFGEVDSTNNKGLYEFQFADARFAVTSAKRLVISVNDGENTILDADYEIELVQFNPFDSVRLGLTALPNATAGANTGLPVVGTQIPNATAGASNGLLISGTNSGTTTLGAFTVTGTMLVNAFTCTNAFTVNGAPLATAASIATAVWQDTTSGDFTVASSIGKSLYTSGNAPGAPSGLALVGSNVGNLTGDVQGKVLGGGASSITGIGAQVDVREWNGTAVFGSIPPDSTFVRTGTAQAGGASTITLDAGASATNNLYQNQVVVIIGGTGVGESAMITSYAGSTKVATINGTWATNPDNTSVFVLVAFGAISASVGGSVTVGGYSAGQDPATYILTTPANKLATDASGRVDVGKILGTASAGAAGYVGIDWSAIHAPTSTVGLSGTTVGTITTYTGNTVQTGDSFARLGAPAGVSIAADLAEIEGETDTLIAGVNVSSFGAGAITASAFGANALDVGVVTQALANMLADSIIRRHSANARASSYGDTVDRRSLLGEISKLVNKWSISGSTLTINQEDDTTPMYTESVGVDPSASPITSLG